MRFIVEEDELGLTIYAWFDRIPEDRTRLRPVPLVEGNAWRLVSPEGETEGVMLHVQDPAPSLLGGMSDLEPGQSEALTSGVNQLVQRLVGLRQALCG